MNELKSKKKEAPGEEPLEEQKRKADKKEKKAKLDAKKYPTKRTVNLAMRDIPKANPKKRMITFAIVGLVLIVGIKFGVADLIVKAMDNDALALSQEAELQEIQAKLVDYAKVEEEYQNYALDQAALGGSKVSTMESLALIEKYLVPAARIETFAVQGDVITATLGGVTLSDVSTIYNALKADEKIVDVRIYTASTGEDQNVTTTCDINIFLQSEEVAPVTEGGGDA